MRPKKCPCGMLCESELEHLFWHFIRKTKPGVCGCEPQKAIRQFRVDALIECDGKKVVVELDGKAFHDKASDLKRDKLILQEVDAVIRIPFAAMWYQYHATFAVLSRWFSRFEIKKDHCLMSLGELKNLVSELETREDASNYVENLGLDVQVWEVNGNIGRVGIPYAFFKNWHLPMITMTLANTTKPVVKRSVDAELLTSRVETYLSLTRHRTTPKAT